MAMKITAEMLREKGASGYCADRFGTEFPDGLKVTRANARKYASRFYFKDIEWAASVFLSKTAYSWYIDNTPAGAASTIVQLAEAFWRASKMED